MAEEIKEKAESGKVAKIILKVILGIVLLVVGLVLVWLWREDLFTLFRGGLGVFLCLAGVITLAIAKE